MAEDKLTDIQEGDEVGYYGAMKEDGSREKLYGIVQHTRNHEAARYLWKVPRPACHHRASRRI